MQQRGCIKQPIVIRSQYLRGRNIDWYSWGIGEGVPKDSCVAPTVGHCGILEEDGHFRCPIHVIVPRSIVKTHLLYGYRDRACEKTFLCLALVFLNIEEY